MRLAVVWFINAKYKILFIKLISQMHLLLYSLNFPLQMSLGPRKKKITVSICTAFWAKVPGELV